MLYLHFCFRCNRLHLLSGHRTYCPACDTVLQELSVSYEQYIQMSASQRLYLLNQCSKPHNHNPGTYSPQHHHTTK